MKTCETCGAELPAPTPKSRIERRFCSSRCRWRAWNRKKFIDMAAQFYDQAHR